MTFLLDWALYFFPSRLRIMDWDSLISRQVSVSAPKKGHCHIDCIFHTHPTGVPRRRPLPILFLPRASWNYMFTMILALAFPSLGHNTWHNLKQFRLNLAHRFRGFGPRSAGCNAKTWWKDVASLTWTTPSSATGISSNKASRTMTAAASECLNDQEWWNES